MIAASSMVDSLKSSPVPLRLILMGVGFWGRTWIEVVHKSRHWDLVALVDSDEAALMRAAVQAGVPPERCFGSIADAAADVEAEAVLIVVPPIAHAEVALDALSAGLHCLIEKPFATTIEQAQSIIVRADEAGRVVMVSQQYRHRAGARTVRKLVDQDVVGEIGAAYVRFANVLPVQGFQQQMDEPFLWDMAIHHFDLIRGVLRLEPTRVQATSYNPRWSEFSGNAAATVVLETGSGAAITYTGNWAPRGRLTQWDGVWEILGERGSIRWHGDDVLVRSMAEPAAAKLRGRILGIEWKGRRISPLPVDEPDRLGCLAELSAAIKQNTPPETSAHDNVRSLALTVAAVESCRRRAAVDVAEIMPDGV